MSVEKHLWDANINSYIDITNTALGNLVGNPTVGKFLVGNTM